MALKPSSNLKIKSYLHLEFYNTLKKNLALLKSFENASNNTFSTLLILDVWLQFWCYAITFTTDIEKVCLQIQIVDPNKTYWRFLPFENYFANAANLSLLCTILKNGQSYFENFAMFTVQDFKSMFGHFLTFCLRGLIWNHFTREKCITYYPFELIQLFERSNYLNMSSCLHLSDKLKECGKFLWIHFWNPCFISIKEFFFVKLQAASLQLHWIELLHKYFQGFC